MLKNILSCGLLSLATLAPAWAETGPSAWDKLREEWSAEGKLLQANDIPVLEAKAEECDAKAAYLLVWVSRQKRFSLDAEDKLAKIYKVSLCPAEKGHPLLMNAVGAALQGGRGVSPDLASSARWYQLAAEKGYALAMDNLGRVLRDGKGVTRNDVEAVRWFRQAANAGHAGSMGSLGLMYEEGDGVAKSQSEAVTWYRRGAEGGDLWSMNELGRMLRDGNGAAQDFAEAYSWFRKAADAGYPHAMSNVGRMHATGRGVDRDDQVAVAWYKKAAEAKNPAGMRSLGLSLRDGLGGQRSTTESLLWLRRAAEAGDANAMHNLGWPYQVGEGLPLDIQKAIHWYSKAADLNFSPSMVNLAQIYLDGDGVKRDAATAARWLARAQASTKKVADTVKFSNSSETGPQRAKRMLDELLASGQITDPEVLKEVRATAQPAPTVQWARLAAQTAAESTELRVRLQDAGGGIGRVELWLNGAVVGQFAPVDEAGRGLAPPSARVDQAQAGAAGAGAGREWAYTLRVSAGQHQLEVRAYNGESLVNFNTLKANLRSTYEPPRKPRLFAVVVGVDDYENSSLRLNYAAADARAVAALLKTQLQGGGLYSGGDVQVLTSKAQTSKAAINRAVRAFHSGQQVRADDVFVFYAAAHGWYDTAQSRYHMLTSDVLHLSPDRLASTAIGDEELRDLIRNVPAQKKLVMLDTCNSGGFARLGAQDLVASRSGLGEQEIINYMQNRTGATVFAASGSQEVAREGYQGHGVFSYFLLEGLKGAAARPGQTLVSSDDLKIYVEEQVPRAMERKGWGKQAPLIAVQGHGFPVVMKP